MFDTVLGLPVHVLVVHGVVVLLPLMAVVTTVWAFTRRAPRWVGWGVVAADAAVVAMAFAARFSGDELQERLGGQVAAEHAEMGEVLPFFALGLLFAAVLVQALRSSDVSVPDRLPAVLTLVVAAIALFWTVRTGHSGSEAVWSSIVQQTGG